MALFPDPFDALSSLQQALDTFRTSGWLATGPSGGGGYPLVNVFRKGDDFVVITEVPGIAKSNLEIQVKGNTIRLAGTKSVNYTLTPRKSEESACQAPLRRFCLIDDPRWLPGQRIAPRPD